MGDEIKPRYYVVFVTEGLEFGSVVINRQMDTWDDLVDVRRQLAAASKVESIENVQIINWKRIE